MGIIQDIPKFYTALAEWMSCLVFVLLLRRRWSKPVTCMIMLASLAVLGVLQHWIGIAHIALWIPGMIVALLIMYGTMLLCCKETAMDIGFCGYPFSSAEQKYQQQEPGGRAGGSQSRGD